MGFSGASIDDLKRIAHVGGGFKMNGRGRTADELAGLAHTASGSRARIIMTGMRGFSVDDLVRIAFAGKGTVQFEEDGGA
jgi:hypothetical protein